MDETTDSSQLPLTVVDLYTARARELMGRRDFPAALDFYSAALASSAVADSPGRAQSLLVNRALIYIRLGNAVAALHDAECCCDVDPRWSHKPYEDPRIPHESPVGMVRCLEF